LCVCLARTRWRHPLERLLPVTVRAAHHGHVERFGATGETSRRMGDLSVLSGLRADGTEFPIEASISQVLVGGEKHYSVILRDVTERHNSEQERQRSLALLQAT